MIILRAYKEHQASYIFQIKQVDLASVARSFGILRLPKMPELKQGFETKLDFVAEEIDTDTIPFTDKLREKQRLIKLAEKKEAPKPVFKNKIESWSDKKDAKVKKVDRKLKKDRKKIAIMKKAQKVIDAGKAPAKRELEDDGEEYKEYLLEKKAKK
jgi:ATP-dependent RNA helicase DDX55/SPB4